MKERRFVNLLKSGVPFLSRRAMTVTLSVRAKLTLSLGVRVPGIAQQRMQTNHV